MPSSQFDAMKDSLDLPTPNSNPDPPRLGRFNRVCERFEALWKEGGSPCIEDFLEGAEEGDRPPLLRELLVIELQSRLRRADLPAQSSYLERFPAYASWVEAAFREACPPDIPHETNGSSPSGHPDGESATATYVSRPANLPHPPPPAGAGEKPAGTGPESPTPAEADPAEIGRYRVQRRLGEGGFGRVFLAWDEDLNRTVAIKVPRRETFRSNDQVEQFLHEARMVAQLRHPAVVAVYDIGHRPDGGIYIVLEYVEGRSLSEVLVAGDYSLDRLIELMARVAEAVHHAHTRGLIHRDLKPANILVDSDGNPRVADFGLALHEDAQRHHGGELAGTAAYMAPEQVRGEAHRLDGRTDIWSLGVILYRLLAGRLPFVGGHDAVFDEILHREPKPPRQIDDAVPKELERIGLKCLSKRMVDRYATALDLAEDLRIWLAASGRTAVAGTGAPPPPAIAETSSRNLISRVIPKGLRAFDGDDSDFFLRLLPGPHDRTGLPESIRSWKAQIESCDGERNFSVGLLYGPSGCGKSSLVRAGLMPRLAPRVELVYLEASPQATEARLRSLLGSRFPALAGEDLAGLFAALRGGRDLPPGGKVLVILDQFEQWLHAHPTEPDTELVRALRQCDGTHVQALILVRDDFWMAITRFFEALEIRLHEGVNSKAVELFDVPHARRVLTEFGRAFGLIPDGPIPPGSELAQFLDLAVAGLSGSDGRVIPVKLCVLAEMVRHRPWVPATLRALGGVEGLGVTFLEETFGTAAPPMHRLHAAAAQATLKALLPEPGSNLKGTWSTARILREASGYTNRPARFEELMHILDHELRMVTPVDLVEARSGAAEDHAPGEICYQLTHDYLVPSLRQWLTRKQRETHRGRAELRLAAITAFWRDRPEPRRLPSTMEWIDFLGSTTPRAWSTDERRMMRAATRNHLLRAGAALAVLAALILGGLHLRDRVRAASLLQQALKADYRHLPALLPAIDVCLPLLRDDLVRLEDDAAASPRDREVAVALLYREFPTRGRAAFLHDRLLGAGPEELIVIRDVLTLHPGPEVREALWRDLGQGNERGSSLRAACALARLEPRSPRWGAAADAVSQALLDEDRRAIPRWIELLDPVIGSFVPPLSRIYRDPDLDPSLRMIASEALAQILGRTGDAKALCSMLVDASPEAFRGLIRELAALGANAPSRSYLDAVLAGSTDGSADEARKDELARRQANAAVALMSLGASDRAWARLRHADDPRLRSLLIERLATYDVNQKVLLECLKAEDDPAALQAVLLAWAEMSPGRVTSQVRAEVLATAREVYRDHPDPGVHSASGLLLRRWGGEAIVARLDAESRRESNLSAERRWLVGPDGLTFAVVPGPLEFWMGSPAHETGRNDNERRHFRRIDRSLAVSTTEVNFGQFRRFDPGHKQDPRFGDAPELPANTVSWFAAARYCNWLSRAAGIAPDQWCYPDPIGPGMTLDRDAVERAGFRLPTEAEWEYLCRARTLARRPFGQSDELLSRHAWTWLNSRELSMPVAQLQPNEFGLFDMLGNQWEWCHDGPPPGGGRDRFPRYPAGTPASPADDRTQEQVLHGEETPRLTQRLARGGSYCYSPSKARSAGRYLATISLRHPYMGFRVVRTLPRSNSN